MTKFLQYKIANGEWTTCPASRVEEFIDDCIRYAARVRASVDAWKPKPRPNYPVDEEAWVRSFETPPRFTLPETREDVEAVLDAGAEVKTGDKWYSVIRRWSDEQERTARGDAEVAHAAAERMHNNIQSNLWDPDER